MLKEYTLKVTVRVGGESDEECNDMIESMFSGFCSTWEITHEEVVEADPWMSQIELDKFPPVEPEVERE